MMRRFSSHVGVTRTGPSACCLEMTLLMQPNICVPLGVRHLVGGQVRRCWCAVRAGGVAPWRRVACQPVDAGAGAACLAAR
jgi:hypothetical protein